MSDYNRQLHAWAIEKIISAKQAGALDVSGLDEIKNAADELAAYCYNPVADLGSVCDYIGEAVRKVPPAKAIELLEVIIRDANVLLEQATAQKAEDDKWAAAIATQPEQAPEADATSSEA